MKPCPRCQSGFEVVQVSDCFYSNGFYTAVRKCRTCMGKKFVPIIKERVALAAGDK